ncbi:MAG: quinoprotein dehydrogenase-associated SoxYZ-like carrier [Pseudomonadota bacterium]|nr:quinoprotein dehydrogenase-associated SoxYZ-like carrier [Pseudomonadota bacterium]
MALWLATAAGAAAQPPDTFATELSRDFFQDRAIVESADFIALDAPMKAEDAALVPVTLAIRTPPGDARRVVKLSLVIDNNPVPLAGVFTLGEKAEVVQIATRVRVNSDTYLHLVAELSDGSLVAAKRYVRAAGGCSAPATKAVDSLKSRLGQLKFRMLPDIVHGHREALVMIRHPNFTGMQLDEGTHEYTPARYVDHFAVYQGDDLVFALDGGISISEDPNFRVAFHVDESRQLRVEAGDIAGARFSAAWTVIGSGG